MTSQPRISSASTASTWDADLQLGFARNPRGTRLVHKRHRGPLYVQKPFYPEGEDLAHVYLLHPPGGLVSGDNLTIAVNCDPQARVLLTTPGAGRVYRARADRTPQRQKITFDVQADAALEWLPLETIVFDGARTQLQTCVRLAAGARYIGWDVTSLGLPANRIDFASGELTQSLRVEVAGKLCLHERLHLPGGAKLMTARAGLQGMPVIGNFIAGPFAESGRRQALLTRLRDLSRDAEAGQCLQGVTWLQGFIVGRFLGHCSEQARKLFASWWSCLRPELMRRTACPPRIWLT